MTWRWGPGRPRLEFRFTSPSALFGERIRFKYRLDGFDPDPGWTEAAGQRLAHYTNLPPGRYTFRVRAANRDGVWNEQGAALAFEVQRSAARQTEHAGGGGAFPRRRARAPRA